MSGSVALTGIVDGRDGLQLVAHASVQAVDADGHNLDLIAAVGQQVIEYCPLVVTESQSALKLLFSRHFLSFKNNINPKGPK